MATVIEKMTGVKISSAYFTEDTLLELFPKHSKPHKSNRIALLYGKNGSGKSTIAQGFREYRDSTDPNTVTLKPTENNSYISNAIPETRERIFVFDEDYIFSRVKIKDSGLDAIVLFGDQVAIDEQIEETKKKIETKKEEISQLETDFNRYTDNNDVNSPSYWNGQIRSKLRETNGWAETGSKIKGQRQNLSVTDTEIDRIGKISPTRSLDELIEELDKKLSQFQAVGTATAAISMRVPLITIEGDICQNTETCLEEVVNRPQLTDRELQLLQLFGLAGATNARAFVSNKENIVCGKCFQTIGDDYRDKVLEEIESILNRDVEDFKEKLEKLMISEISIDTYQAYRNLTSYNKVRDSIEEYSKAVISHNRLIQVKIDNPFEKKTYDGSIEIIKACDFANQALTELEADRINFNRIINERASVIKELLELNDDIAHYSIQNMLSSRETQQREKHTAEGQLNNAREALITLIDKMTQLDSQRKNYQVASDEINNSLGYVFFSKERLSLELGPDQVYHLKVNGKLVNPNKVSCGERNALALSYFFTEIAKDMEANAIYTEELLLVIDDPVSSFDLENRIGIISFLRWKLEKILDSCTTTKILVMTHDISVMFDLEKAFQEISKHCEKMSSNAEYCLFHLESKRLSNFMYRKHNEYTQLLQRVYQYAKNPTVDSDLDLAIGNMMRRVLEAFASFSFKLGIDEVSLDERVLGLLPDEETRTYYRNLMYRLVLNNESHFMENIQGAPEGGFFSHLSSNEKQRTAKDVLCFIFSLNKAHVLSHVPDAEADLILWSTK